MRTKAKVTTATSSCRRALVWEPRGHSPPPDGPQQFTRPEGALGGKCPEIASFSEAQSVACRRRNHCGCTNVGVGSAPAEPV